MRIQPEAAIYNSVRCLGEGMSSVVYLAERCDSRSHTSQMVALKILKSKKRIHWLKREFESLRSVDSEHCVRLLAWDNLSGGGAALVMDAIDGVTLEELARAEPLTTAEADEVARQAQAGLLALRAAGLRHGDMSPRNALIDRNGRLRLIDFGESASAEYKSEFFKRRGRAVTPAYAAPETWRGTGDWTSDLFSLALLRMDLIDGFTQADGLRSDSCARARAAAAAISGDPWLDPTPTERGPRSIDLCEVAKATLAVRVHRLLDARAHARAQMQTRAVVAPVTKLRAAAVVAVAAAAIVLPRAVASGQDLRRGEKPASIDIASHHWREIWLNGQRIGFAPLKASRLRAGGHRVCWRGANGSGERRVEVTAGEALRLRALDLEIVSAKVRCAQER